MNANVVKIIDNFSERDKTNVYKFTVSLSMANDEKITLLEKYGIFINKCRELKILAIDEKTLKQTLELASKMGFIDAYQKSPNRLCISVTDVIKRIGKCDAMGINYHKENGDYEEYLFSNKAFQSFIKTIPSNVTKIVEPPKEVEEPSINTNVESSNNAIVKDYALRVLEQFDMTDQKDRIYKRIDEIKDSSLGVKEMLVEAFKVFGGSRDLLINTIDEIINQNEDTMRRTA